MNATEMRQRLVETRLTHRTHQAGECDGCFLMDVIDTMVARSWDPASGGPRTYSAESQASDPSTMRVTLDGQLIYLGPPEHATAFIVGKIAAAGG